MKVAEMHLEGFGRLAQGPGTQQHTAQDGGQGKDAAVEPPVHLRELLGLDALGAVHAAGAVVEPVVFVQQASLCLEFLVEFAAGHGGKNVKARNGNARIFHKNGCIADALFGVGIKAHHHLGGWRDAGYRDAVQQFFVLVDLDPLFVEFVESFLGDAFQPETQDVAAGIGDFLQQSRVTGQV